MATNNAINVPVPFSVANGGTGATTLTAHAVLGGNTTSTPTQLTAGTNGQLLLGSTGADPVFATITSSDSSMVFTTGAGSLAIGTRVVQHVNTTTSSTTTNSSTIAITDTIPQNTDGTELFTLSITPTNANNTLYIRVEVNVGGGASEDVCIALFQDSTANALAARGVSVNGTTSSGLALLTHIMTAGTTSSTTFKIRIGTSSGSAWTVNGISSGVAKMGGVSIATFYIFEMA